MGGPCQSTHFVARPAVFDGSLHRQPENPVPDNFNRERRFLQNKQKKLPPTLFVFLQYLPRDIVICSLQRTTGFCTYANLQKLEMRKVKVLVACYMAGGAGERGVE